MKPKKPDPLADLLKDSLARSSADPVSAPAPDAPLVTIVPPPIQSLPPLLKATVSLHGEEQEKALQILDVLRKSRSKAGGLSDAVKIALRLCPLDPARIGEAWESARAQDGRARRRV